MLVSNASRVQENGRDENTLVKTEHVSLFIILSSLFATLTDLLNLLQYEEGPAADSLSETLFSTNKENQQPPADSQHF